MAIHTLPDITVTAAAQVVSAISVKANWVLLVGVTISGTARIGDSAISSTQGATMLAAKDTVYFPPAGNANMYNLNEIYTLGTAGNKIAVLYATD
jgi:hypothetical protein